MRLKKRSVALLLLLLLQSSHTVSKHHDELDPVVIGKKHAERFKVAQKTNTTDTKATDKELPAAPAPAAVVDSSAGDKPKSQQKNDKVAVPKKPKADAGSSFEFVEAVPAEFADLSAEQTSAVDIYYADQLIASQMASFNLETITFSNVDEILGGISDLKDAPPVKKVLEGVLPVNDSEICYQARSESNKCGILFPDVAGVIFDSSTFRADVFVNPDYLTEQDLNIKRYLPHSDGKPAIMQTLSANLSGDLNNRNDSEDNYTFYGKTMMSEGENHFTADWNVSKDNNFSFNEFQFQRDWHGLQWQTGLLNSSGGFGLNFSSSRSMLGTRITTSFDTRLDRSLTEGSSLRVFMPTRGRYEVIYEGRLIGSGFLDSGDQPIDTTNFPTGAYQVTIKLFDEGGVQIDEKKQFFSKQNRLPPSDDPEYFFEVGKAMLTDTDSIMPENTDAYLVRSGINYRLGESSALTAAVASSEGENLAEFSLFTMGEGFEFSPGFMFKNADTYGATLDARLELGRLTIDGNYNELWNDEPIVIKDKFEFVGESFRQAGAGLTYPLLNGDFSYNISESRTVDMDEVRQSVSYYRTIFQNGAYSVDMRLSGSRTDNGDKIGLATFEFRTNSEHWQFQAASDLRYEDSDSYGVARASANYYDNEQFDSEVRADFTAEQERDRTALSGSTYIGTTWGTADIGVNYNNTGGNKNTGYSTSLSSSFVATEEGMALGGEDTSESAVVVRVSGASLDQTFDVYVNGRRESYALGGKPSIIRLSPFNTYTIGVKPAGDAIYSFDEKQYKLTLYPGNVVNINYDVSRVVVLFGKIQNQRGTIIKNAKIKGAEGMAYSDEFGIFQAEVTEGTKNLTFVSGKDRCVLALDKTKLTSDNTVVNVGLATCKSSSDTVQTVNKKNNNLQKI